MFSESKKNRGVSTEGAKEQNKISQGTTITGNIEGKGSFRIEGRIEGNLKTSGKVVVGKTGFVNGEIECDSADFEGKFSGKMVVKETLSLKSTAFIEGEVITGNLQVDHGATFNSTCVMKGSVKTLEDDGKRGKRKKERIA
ncbi:bactofilin family protein [Mesonia aestuariivivens]|uniref:Polymer-forming cytoskeletal protein n=1 Tax=Mesonia aestuariivivens TaxID=2796128 RepID=A0ABS6VX41_9FLAO|nr:polymer-forming cytoskeletal protein [Mesonia aestuariivivens]MBW2960187.1 polymer-forming cytoskeletal protein [Mesonia aestuariivivens]